MNSGLTLAATVFMGVLIGLFYFGGLRITIDRGLISERPVLWFFTSFVLRTLLTLAGVWWLTGGEPLRLLACMIGFTAARTWMIRTAEPKGGVPGENQP